MPMAAPLSSDVHPSCEFDQQSGVRWRHFISGIPEAAVSDLGDELDAGAEASPGVSVWPSRGIWTRKTAVSQSSWGGDDRRGLCAGKWVSGSPLR